ncbi:hypothetical protein QSV34_13560 [Porticoccus sp. W117]|uniref:acyltransferase n=1 Tax=Porticoccus sp. W117 TaxID=3054777 RepID=UPI0025938A4D|nr:hypothetical protein [Porticoccus sp. W117]MDM3872375.1 hypothetical protein [Porticoccus sp. W117]
MKRVLRCLICLFFPASSLKNLLLRGLGWNVDKNAKICNSLILTRSVRLGSGSRIGFFNVIKVDALALSENAYIQNANRISGPIIVVLKNTAAIGNFNIIRRAPKGVVWGRSILKLGILSKITSRHYVDCTRSVILGDYTTVAGIGSQLWTHGYIHDVTGTGRFRVDGSIRVGNNVYIGSSSIFNAGVTVAHGVTVGAASVVAKSLLEPGMYVGQPLRYIPFEYEESRSRYPKVKSKKLVEEVHNKKNVYG